MNILICSYPPRRLLVQVVVVVEVIVVAARKGQRSKRHPRKGARIHLQTDLAPRVYHRIHTHFEMHATSSIVGKENVRKLMEMGTMDAII